jgi:hypothetical protein
LFLAEGLDVDGLCVVMTTINEPNEKMLSWIDDPILGIDQLIVVGDTKTNDEAWKRIKNSRLKYLSFEDCEDKYGELSTAIGSRTYARKNFGYLSALENGAKKIFETDDDTFLRSNVGDVIKFYEKCHQFKVTSLKPKNEKGIYNPFTHFAPRNHIWPRGLPLRQVNQNYDFQLAPVIPEMNSKEKINDPLKSIDVIQSLVNLDPDVDSVFRMTSKETIVDYPLTADLLILDNVLAPGNTQSTLWLNSELFCWAYIPQTVSIRFCDILKMYVAQWRSKMAYAGFVTEQFRNNHDLMQDFKYEVELFTKIELLIELIQENKPQSLIDAYRILFNAGIVLEKELEIVSLYQSAFDKLLNKQR